MTEREREQEEVRGLLADAAAQVVGKDFQLTAEQVAVMLPRVEAELARVEKIEPPEYRVPLFQMAVYLVVLEGLGLTSPRRVDFEARASELGALGAQVLVSRLKLGGYPVQHPNALRGITDALSREACSLAERVEAEGLEAIREEMRATASRLVVLYFGEPPVRGALN